MFTGIIEEIGKIENKRNDSSNEGTVWSISCSFSNELKIGESVSIDGICHTVIKCHNGFFEVFSSLQTVKISNFGAKQINHFVNLERSMKLNDRLSGHLVYGHGDTVAELMKVTSFEKSKLFVFELKNKNFMKYLVSKGSIAVNGISLTIYEKTDTSFTVMIIEHTFENTVLKHINVGDTVNIELDIVGKYIKGF